MKQDHGLPKIERPQSLEEQAYLHIKKAILDGVLPPGEFVAELQLAQELGISRTPLRKAMARLLEENFLINIPFKGYYVADISTEDVRDIYELRRVLECYLVRETASKFTSVELDEMEENIRAAIDAFERGDFIDYVAYNREFHHAFPRKHGNQRILKMLTNLDEHIQRTLMYKLYDGQAELLSPRDHQLILKAIKAGEVEAAAQLMREHLMGFQAMALAQSERSKQKEGGSMD
jgi:DNA-binding GntR family transcriptional regulator